jgi:putative flippase GtrA
MDKSLSKWGISPDLLKFLVVGITNTLGGYAVYAALVALGVNYAVALTLEYVAGIAYGFALNKRWTFKAQGDTLRQAWRYSAFYGVIYLLNVGLLMALVERWGLNPYVSQLILLGFLTCLSFGIQKSWIFAEVQKGQHDQQPG